MKDENRGGHSSLAVSTRPEAVEVEVGTRAGPEDGTEVVPRAQVEVEGAVGKEDAAGMAVGIEVRTEAEIGVEVEVGTEDEVGD